MSQYRTRVGDPVAVLHPESQRHVVPSVNGVYDADDPLVREYPWLFVEVGESVDPGFLDQRQFNNAVEDASAEPGRRRGRPRKQAEVEPEAPAVEPDPEGYVEPPVINDPDSLDAE